MFQPTHIYSSVGSNCAVNYIWECMHNQRAMEDYMNEALPEKQKSGAIRNTGEKWPIYFVFAILLCALYILLLLIVLLTVLRTYFEGGPFRPDFRCIFSVLFINAIFFSVSVSP